MEKSLKEFKPGESGVVIKINGEGTLKRRIFDMGITPGVSVTMRKAAPLGDPIEITIRGYELSIRKSEAAIIILNSQGGNQS